MIWVSAEHHSATECRAVAKFVTFKTLLAGVGAGSSRVGHIQNSTSGGRRVAEFLILRTQLYVSLSIWAKQIKQRLSNKK